jgi:hypothetical protein
MSLLGLLGILPRDTMAQDYWRLCIRIEAMMEAADGFHLIDQ